MEWREGGGAGGGSCWLERKVWSPLTFLSSVCSRFRCSEEFFSQSGNKDKCSPHLGISRGQQPLPLYCRCSGRMYT